MEEQEELKELNLEIGTEEATKLKAEKVKIEKVEIKLVGAKRLPKLICFCKHSASDTPIEISAVRYVEKGKLETRGLFLTKDNKGFIKKGSALAIFIQSQDCKSAGKLVGKTVDTVQDDNGFLVFKIY